GVALLRDSARFVEGEQHCRHPGNGSPVCASGMYVGQFQWITSRSGTATQARLCHESIPHSASWTPFAPSSRFHGNGSPVTRWRRNSSHCALNALSKISFVGIVDQPSRKSIGLGISGFQVGRGVRTLGWITQSRSPATADPFVPSTCSV